MGLYKRKDSPFWWYSFKVDSVRTLESTYTSDKKLAEKIYFKRRTEAIEAKHFPSRSKIKLAEMIQIYLKDHSKSKKKSFSNDITISKRISEFFGDCLLSEITTHRVEQYRNERLMSVSKARVNREMAFLRHVFTKAIAWNKWYGENPVKKVQPFKEERKPERYLTPEERQRLFKASPEHLRPIIMVGLKTGMRQSEILRLKWEDVDLARGWINVRNTKSGNLRQIPIHNELGKILAELPKKGEFVFCDQNGKHYSRFGVLRDAFDRAVKEAKITNFTFHDTRHTFASELVDKGVDVRTVQEYLGHSTIAVTERYLHSASDSKQSAIQVLSNEDYERNTSVTQLGQNPLNTVTPGLTPSDESMGGEGLEPSPRLRKSGF